MCLGEETRHENGEHQMVNGKVKLTFEKSFIAFFFQFLSIVQVFLKKLKNSDLSCNFLKKKLLHILITFR